MAADEPVLAAFLQPMGLHNTRAYKLKRFSQVHNLGETQILKDHLLVRLCTSLGSEAMKPLLYDNHTMGF